MKYTHKSNGIELDCELEFCDEEAGFMEDGLQMTPTIPAEMVLVSACLNGIELFDVLADWFVTEIEDVALELHLDRKNNV